MENLFELIGESAPYVSVYDVAVDNGVVYSKFKPEQRRYAETTLMSCSEGLRALGGHGALACAVANNPARRYESPWGGSATRTSPAISPHGRCVLCRSWGGNTGTVCHHITGSVFPNWIGTVQRRKATVKGNRLVLSSESLLMGGSESVVVLEWQRMER
ncbi:lipocalin-like domain-containing protein [Archangium violaceum]|uniref:Lipocalin-like domain-containing protein n=1 Tax=Archangium violaceum Cb vi76 TaxID=1406225 RepID=A0A084SUN3_9BACT|nr:lipocalin-like domain-containing protein [Archangium violaceum]KFA92168.1 hypothetical protein Q664_17900 [Archangium violaceum Cb vi76]